MKTFKEYSLLSERFINLFDKDKEEREKEADHVFDMITQSYKGIGGIKGNGFKSPEDMVKNIAFWKLYRSEGKIRACAMYKDKGGRKLTAMATDGSDAGKLGLGEILKADFKQKRAYSEISDSALGFTRKLLGAEMVHHAMKFAEAKKILDKNGDTDAVPAPHDSPEVMKYPDLKDCLYTRSIGGEPHVKLMVGFPDMGIFKK